VSVPLSKKRGGWWNPRAVVNAPVLKTWWQSVSKVQRLGNPPRLGRTGAGKLEEDAQVSLVINVKIRVGNR
jgi:hypothetical protein